ncbi:phosphorylase family protein [Granulicella tundricola]|uniref:phosphorylase family protein n=1 Tax=Granulicella tundricola TaxID=940615 RepID=UPI0003070647|nr:phosphorylase [Granulicella tundricola]
MGIPAIIAALPREVRAFVRGVQPDPAQKRAGVYVYRLPGAVVVCAGMGAVRAGMAVQAALGAGEISVLVSAGLAGGCDPGLAVGRVMEARTVVDSASGERFETECGGDCGVLVTSHAIAGVREKERLFATYGAGLVDMEAATVARMAVMHGLPFRAIKAVSDAHDFELSSLSRFATVHGHFRTGAFALHTAVRPASWRHAMKLGSGSQLALLGLTEALKQL